MRRKHVGIVCALLAVVLILAGLMPIVTANTGISQARYGVLRILCDGNQGISTGTGFIIAQDGQGAYIATNYHVIEDNPDAVFIIPENIRGPWLPASVIYHQPGLDIVILSVESGLEDRPVLPLVSTETVNFADTVYAIGFPGAADEVIDDSNLLPSTADDVTITDGTVSNPSRKLDDGVSAIHSTAALTYGNSGGPLLNDKAEVIGINTWIYSEGAYGISYSIHIDYIIDICTQLGIPYVSLRSDVSGQPADDTPAPSAAPEVSSGQPDSIDAAPPLSSNTGAFLYNNIGFILVFGSLIMLGTLTLVIVITQKGNFGYWISQHKAAVAIVSTGFVIALVVGIILPIVFATRFSESNASASDSPGSVLTQLPGSDLIDEAPSQPVLNATEPDIPAIATPDVLPISNHDIIGTWELTEGVWLNHFGLSDTIFFMSNSSVCSSENSTWADWYLIGDDTLWVVDWFGEEHYYTYTIAGGILTLEDSYGGKSSYEHVSGSLLGDWSYADGNWIWVFGFSPQVTFSANTVFLSRIESSVPWRLSDTEKDVLIVWDADNNCDREFRYSISSDVLMLVDEDEDWSFFAKR